MSRVKARRWVALVAGLLVGTATATAQVSQPGDTLTVPPTGRPSQAHVALHKALECHNHGDYDLAAQLIRDLLARQGDLSSTERRAWPACNRTTRPLSPRGG